MTTTLFLLLLLLLTYLMTDFVVESKTRSESKSISHRSHSHRSHSHRSHSHRSHSHRSHSHSKSHRSHSHSKSHRSHSHSKSHKSDSHSKSHKSKSHSRSMHSESRSVSHSFTYPHYITNQTNTSYCTSYTSVLALMGTTTLACGVNQCICTVDKAVFGLQTLGTCDIPEIIFNNTCSTNLTSLVYNRCVNKNSCSFQWGVDFVAPANCSLGLHQPATFFAVGKCCHCQSTSHSLSSSLRSESKSKSKKSKSHSHSHKSHSHRSHSHSVSKSHKSISKSKSRKSHSKSAKSHSHSKSHKSDSKSHSHSLSKSHRSKSHSHSKSHRSESHSKSRHSGSVSHMSHSKSHHSHSKSKSHGSHSHSHSHSKSKSHDSHSHSKSHKSHSSSKSHRSHSHSHSKSHQSDSHSKSRKSVSASHKSQSKSHRSKSHSHSHRSHSHSHSKSHNSVSHSKSHESKSHSDSHSHSHSHSKSHESHSDSHSKSHQSDSHSKSKESKSVSHKSHSKSHESRSHSKSHRSHSHSHSKSHESDSHSKSHNSDSHSHSHSKSHDSHSHSKSHESKSHSDSHSVSRKSKSHSKSHDSHSQSDSRSKSHKSDSHSHSKSHKSHSHSKSMSNKQSLSHSKSKKSHSHSRSHSYSHSDSISTGSPACPPSSQSDFQFGKGTFCFSVTTFPYPNVQFSLSCAAPQKFCKFHSSFFGSMIPSNDCPHSAFGCKKTTLSFINNRCLHKTSCALDTKELLFDTGTQFSCGNYTEHEITFFMRGHCCNRHLVDDIGIRTDIYAFNENSLVTETNDAPDCPVQLEVATVQTEFNAFSGIVMSQYEAEVNAPDFTVNVVNVTAQIILYLTPYHRQLANNYSFVANAIEPAVFYVNGCDQYQRASSASNMSNVVFSAIPYSRNFNIWCRRTYTANLPLIPYWEYDVTFNNLMIPSILTQSVGNSSALAIVMLGLMPNDFFYIDQITIGYSDGSVVQLPTIPCNNYTLFSYECQCTNYYSCDLSYITSPVMFDNAQILQP